MYEDLICQKDTQIEGMKSDLLDAEKKKKMEEEIFKQQLLDEASRRKQRDYFYQPIPGDIVDEMFAVAVNASQYQVRIVRHGEGQYTYGTKKIHANLMQEKLVVRIAGGYLLIEEFLKQYGESE